ncbi:MULTISPECIES: hypothetical protein [unclassified Mesorhizobium]|uniref:hypothetical protein n=1 Tax=unclassified Mesorhizobium TaxID=325217 RepID=UPI0015E32B11|nr:MULTISPECIES: hypothetical protein [unclassified Mesorhizobium]
MTSPWSIMDEYDPDLHGSPASDEPDTIPPAEQRYMAVWLTVAIVVAPFAIWWLL